MTTSHENLPTSPADSGRRRPAAQGSRKQVSAIIKLAKLISKSFREPMGIPTAEQAAEMKRLCAELDEIERTRTGARRAVGFH